MVLPPTEAEINEAAEKRAEKPCACCGFPLGMRQVVDRIEFGAKKGDERGKPSLESLHDRCYEYVKTRVEMSVARERERKVG